MRLLRILEFIMKKEPFRKNRKHEAILGASTDFPKIVK